MLNQIIFENTLILTENPQKPLFIAKYEEKITTLNNSLNLYFTWLKTLVNIYTR